jgi:hypothetical protein
MATNDLIPLFLSDPAQELEKPDIGRARDVAGISKRILKTSILVVAAAAIVFPVLSVRNPAVLFANATASLVGTLAPDGTGQPMPTIQSTVLAQALPPTATEAPTGDEIAATFKSAPQNQTEISQPPAESLFEQFRAWAAEQDARARVSPVQPVQDAQAQASPVQPVQDAQAQVVQNARVQIRPVQRRRQARSAQKHREARPVQNARAEIRPVKNVRAQRRQNARVQVRPVQNTQAPDRSVQNTQAPWPLQSFGWLN